MPLNLPFGVEPHCSATPEAGHDLLDILLPLLVLILIDSPEHMWCSVITKLNLASA